MTLTDEVLADLEKKAKGALEVMSPDVRAERWHVRQDVGGISIEVQDPNDPDMFESQLDDTEGTLSLPTAEHIAAADPLAVLALVAEVVQLREQVKALEQRKDDEYEEATRDAFRAARLATLAECEKEAQAESDEWQARLNFTAGAGALKTRDRIRALMQQPVPTPKVTP